MTKVSYPPQLVRDLMSVGVTTCPPDMPVQEVAHILLERGLEEAVVLEEGHNMGVVGRYELAKAYATGNWENLTAGDVMSPGVQTILPDIPITTAVQIMLDRNVRTLYITHHAGGVEYPAAYLSFQHLLRHIAAKSQADLADLGIEARRQSPLISYLQRRDETRKRLTKISK